MDDDDEEEDDEEEDDEEEDDEEDDDDDDDEEEDDDEADEEEDDVNDDDNDDHDKNPKKISMATERVLTNEDFKKIKKLKTIVAENGSIDSDALDSSSDAEEEDEGNNADWILNPEKLGSLSGKKFHDSKRKAAEERKAAFLQQKDSRRGGLTNKEKKRMKPLMMSVQKEAKRKRGMSASQKFKQARNHVSNLKKQIGPQKRRRSGKSARR